MHILIQNKCIINVLTVISYGIAFKWKTKKIKQINAVNWVLRLYIEFVAQYHEKLESESWKSTDIIISQF